MVNIIEMEKFLTAQAMTTPTGKGGISIHLSMWQIVEKVQKQIWMKPIFLKHLRSTPSSSSQKT